MRQGNDGLIDFVDRAKDMLKVGGENVAASETESVLRLVDGVSAVAVVGQQHPMLDEVPVAFIELLPEGDKQEVRRSIAEQSLSLADFKRPREVFFVDAIPESTLGKAAKASLRELASLAAATRSIE